MIVRHPWALQTGTREARSGILILGGGFGGATVAQKLGRTGATLVSSENALLFTPMLPEVASGSIEPRHVSVPLRQMCPHVDLTVGDVTEIDTDEQTVSVHNEVSEIRYHYDQLIIAIGAISRTLPIPGLEKYGVGFKTFQDAVFLRNHVLRELDLANDEPSPERAAGHLGFVFVGGGYAGVEALAELHDLVRDALRDYPRLRTVQQRWVLVEAQDRILSVIPTRLGDYAADLLARRGVEIYTGTKLQEVRNDRVVLEGDRVIPAHTLVWSAGVKPHPLVPKFGLPMDQQGRIKVDEHLRVEGFDNVWALGDVAAVPNRLTPGRNDPPTSQHAIRQGRHLAKNLQAAMSGEQLQPYGYQALGQVATLGRYRGIAEVMGRRFSGFLGWLITRAYHVYALPLMRRRLRVLSDWLFEGFFRRDVVSYGAIVTPPALGTLPPPPGSHG